MKTISELNTKWWYRLLKVVYIVTLLVLSIFSAINVFDQNSPYSIDDYQNSTVTCLDGNKKIYSYSELLLSSEEALSYEKIFVLCNLPQTYRDSIQNKIASVPEGDTTSEKMEMRIRQGRIKAEVQNKVLYKEAIMTIGSKSYAYFSSVVTVLAILVLFELIRRIFYYIVLGSLRPKKKHESDTILP